MKIGLIGCGRISERGHMVAYSSMNDAEIVAVADINSDKAKSFADKFRIRKIFTDYVDLLEIKDLDFVDICTPTSTHCSIACDAMRYGHNVFLEKPMALSVFECEKMMQESKKNRVKLCICHNQIFDPSIRQAKSITDGMYEDLISFRTSIKENEYMFDAPSWNTSPKEGGFLWEWGIHLAYLQLHFLQNIKEVYAIGGKLKHQVYDDFVVLFRTQNQSYGIIELSLLAKEPERLYEINFSNGSRLQLDFTFNYFTEKSRNISKSWKRELLSGFYSDLKRVFGKRVKYTLSFLRKRQLFLHYSHFQLIRNFIESIKTDSPPPVGPEEGKNAIRLLECIRKSLDEHRVVTMK